MKLFNKALCLVALCAMSSASAKNIGATTAQRPGYSGGTEYTGGGESGKKPARAPLNQYIQIWRTRSGLNKTISNRVIFTKEIILSLQKYIQDEQLGSDIFTFILKAVRDSQFVFTGNDAKDLIILQDSNEQINHLASQLGKIDYENTYLRFINNYQEYEKTFNAA